MIRRFTRRIGKSERGASLVEFAIVVPVLLLLVFGIIEFGWIMHGYITLSGAAREGVRAAVVMDGSSIEVDTVEDIIKNHARIFDADKLDIDTGGAVGFKQDRVVTVEGELDLLTGFIPISPVNLFASASMRQEVSSTGSSPGNGGSDSGSQPPAFSSICDSSTSSELILLFDNDVANATYVDPETGETKSIQPSGSEVNIFFNPSVDHNTDLSVTVSNNNGDESEYDFRYHQQHKWQLR